MCTLRLLPLALIAVSLTWSCEPEVEVPEGPPNIVLITLDTLRADRVGGPSSLTPTIDALAARSSVFERAITPIATTGPAHATLFTGLPPRFHGVRWNGDNLQDQFTTAASLMSEAGYDTAAFVSMPMLISGMRLGRGFDTSSDKERYEWATRPGVEVNRLAKEWLKTPRNKPFFMWLHYFEVHSPYRLTPYAKERLADYDGFFAKGADTEEFYSIQDGYPAAAQWNDENIAALNTLYDGEVVEVDKLIADMLRALETSTEAGPNPNNTIVILTADHGQVLGEHHQLGHGFMTWEEALRVPLVIHDPRATASSIGERVGLIDLFPTLLDYARVPIPEGTSGRSLRPAIHGAELPSAIYLAETRRGTREQQTIVALEGSNKVVIGYERSGAFDLNADPQEMNPLPVESSPDFQRLASIAIEYFAVKPPPPQKKKVDQERLDELRSLGYTDNQ